MKYVIRYPSPASALKVARIPVEYARRHLRCLTMEEPDRVQHVVLSSRRLFYGPGERLSRYCKAAVRPAGADFAKAREWLKSRLRADATITTSSVDAGSLNRRCMV